MFFEPDDCTGRTTLDRVTHVVIPVVIHDRKIVYHRNHTGRRIDGTLAARITGDFAFRERRVSFLQVLAGNPEPVTDGVQREQIFGTGIDAISTSGTEIVNDDREFVFIHDYRIRVTDNLAITEAKAPPETTFTAAGHQRGAAA